MNYELAQQLKEAGFPQTPRDIENMDSFVFVGQIPKSSFESIEPGEIHQIADVRIPTLSELIEACGDKFRYLERNGAQFVAKADKNTYSAEGYFGAAQTPEEAVARLYLALNPYKDEKAS